MSEPQTRFEEPLPPCLSEREKRMLSARVHEALCCLLEGRPALTPSREDLSGPLSERHGVFVTLRIGEELRGCIGTVRPRASLFETVGEYAQASAARDPRFPAVTLDELSLLDIEISVLSPLVPLGGEPVTWPRRIQPGRHGLQIEWGLHRGLLLPQVASRYQLTAEEFLGLTAEKAGLERDAWREDGVRLLVFTAEVFTAERP